ncbi:MAG TPA: cellulose biosynthesis cyclic di-GMP-binding regulatory protein BcsB [Gammaproteobacteria bacterium]
MRLPALLLAYLAVIGTARAVAVDEGVSSGTTRKVPLVTTVAELGYPSGFSFDDSSLPDARIMVIPLPHDTRIDSAALHLVYRASPLLDPRATLRIAINDRPLAELSLIPDDTPRELQIPIPPVALLAGGRLKVTVLGNVPTSYGRCVDGQPVSGVIHIYPESRLITYQDGPAFSLRDAWQALPGQVTISLPDGPLDEAMFRAALNWVVLLQRHHRQVRLTTLPELGELVIASAHEIRTTLAPDAGKSVDDTPLWSDEGANVGVVWFKGRQFIAATPPYADAEQFALRWQDLVAPAQITTAPPRQNEERGNRIALAALGLYTGPALLGHKLQWSATITPWRLPPGMRPETAHLKVVLPRSEAQQTFRLYAYLNDMLVKGERLRGDGSEYSLAIPFDQVRRSEVYNLRLVARDDSGNDCRAPGQHYPIELSPESHLTLQPETLAQSGFVSLPSVLGAGFDLYLPRAWLAEARQRLPMLGQLLAGFVVPPADYRLLFFDTSVPPPPARSFIVAAENPPGEVDPALRFDQGSVELIAHQGETLIDDRRLRQSSILQMIHIDDATGLWIHPGEIGTLPVIDANRLGDNDVAVYERDHLALTIDSRQEDLVRPRYPEAPRWYERLHAQRFVWLLVAWLVLTLGIIYLHAKSRQHRNS